MSAHDLTPDEIRTTADLLAMTEQAERGRLCERCRAVGKILRNALRVKIEEQDEVIAGLRVQLRDAHAAKQRAFEAERRARTELEIVRGARDGAPRLIGSWGIVASREKSTTR